MGRDLIAASAEMRALFAEADAILGYGLSSIILDGPEAELRRTANTQPALLLIGTALYRLLGLAPTAVAGHSLGEYTALVAAGALTFTDAIRLVHNRGRYMQEAVPEGQGLMLALIGVEAEAVERAVREVGEGVDVANYNAPEQIVIAGAPGPTRAAAERAGARQAIELPVSAPFHSRLMLPAEARLRVDLDRTAFADLAFPLYSNVDAARVTSGAAARDALARQVSRAVRWTDLVRAMIDAESIDTVVEIGPGAVLSGLIRRIDRRVRRLNVSDLATVESVRNLLTAEHNRSATSGTP